MADYSIVIFSNGKTIYKGGDEKSSLLARRSRRSNKANNKVIHSIFEDAASYIEEDPFWHKILTDASKGIFPRMYRYKDGILSFRYKAKVTSKEICQDNAIICLKNIQDFMRGNGLYSARDHAQRMEEINNLMNEEANVEVEWKGIRSKKKKILYISEYITNLSYRYKLSKLELSALINIVRMANSMGLVNKSTVIMQNNRIGDITVLCYDKVWRDFYLDSSVAPPKLSRATIRKITDEAPDEDEPEICIKAGGVNISKSRSADWNKFLTSLGKKYVNYEKLAELEDKIRNRSTMTTTVSTSIDTGTPNTPSEMDAPRVKRKRIIVREQGA